MSRQGRVILFALAPLAGERHKSSHLLVIRRNWRSKWHRVACMGGARRCAAGECAHVKLICETYERCRPEARA